MGFLRTFFIYIVSVFGSTLPFAIISFVSLRTKITSLENTTALSFEGIVAQAFLRTEETSCEAGSLRNRRNVFDLHRKALKMA